jgi:hypothetical protein
MIYVLFDEDQIGKLTDTIPASSENDISILLASDIFKSKSNSYCLFDLPNIVNLQDIQDIGTFDLVLSSVNIQNASLILSNPQLRNV